MASKRSKTSKTNGSDSSIHDFLREKSVKLQFPETCASFPIQEITTSSCRVACPAGVNIKAYLGAITQGDFERALEIVKETNPLPGICGRVCTHPCESECRRGEFDDPIAICALKRFIADYELKHGSKKIKPCERTKKEKVAIVGSGPAGLTSANDLVRMGYGVTIFEELPVAGGMLITGIPPYRLPRDIIQVEIDNIVKLGVEVYILYRRSRKEMPANEDEINEAEAEGVKINYLAAPVRIIGKDGKVTGMGCTKMKLGEPDKSGRRRPIPIPGSEFVVEADIILSAISQKPDISCFKDCGVKITKWDTFEVDEKTLVTSKPGVFAGGDAVTGPNTVIDAIAAGHRAANAIDRYICGKPLEKEKPPEIVQRELVPDMFSPERATRLNPQKIPVKKREGSFAEVELTLNEDEAVREAKRCLRCGPCFECIHCVKECGKRMVGISTDKSKEMLIIHGLPKDMKLTEEVHAMLNVKGKVSAEVKIEPIISEVSEEMCRGCGQCENVCNYSAIKVEEKEDDLRIAHVDAAICKGCGTCVSVCPTGAAHLKFFKTKDIEAELEDFFG